MFQNADTFIGDARRGDDRVMHDLESDAIDQVIRYDLSYYQHRNSSRKRRNGVLSQRSPPLKGL